MSTTHQTRVSRRRPGTAQRERIMSKKSKSRTGGKGKLPGKAKKGPPTCDRVVENPEHKWRLALEPRRPSRWPRTRHSVQNVGPAVFEVTVGDRESVILMPQIERDVRLRHDRELRRHSGYR